MEKYLLVFMSFIATMNPLTNTTVFFSITNTLSKRDKNKVAKTAIAYSALFGALFFLFGISILNLFGITIPAFQIGGGIIVFAVGYDMLMNNKDTSDDANKPKSTAKKLEIAISPLAIPLIVGPGSIAAIVTLTASSNWMDIGLYFIVFLVVLALNLVSFIYGKKVLDFLGNQGVIAITKIMGLILIIIGTQMMINGIEVLTHNLMQYYFQRYA